MKRIFSLLALVLFVALLFTGCGIQVPRPETKYSEFDFSVTYEYKGEIKTVSGVYVCEYDGTAWYLDGGYSREWKGYIKGGMDTLIEIDRIDDDVVWLDLEFYPEYFMSDPTWNWMGAPEPMFSIKVQGDEGIYFENDPEIIEKDYGAKIISYEYAEPIENSFSVLG